MRASAHDTGRDVWVLDRPGKSEIGDGATELLLGELRELPDFGDHSHTLGGLEGFDTM